VKRLAHNLILSVLTLSIKLWGKEPRFKEWVQLEEQKEKIVKAVREGMDFPTELLTFLSTALHVSSKYYEEAEWEKVIMAFYTVLLKFPHLSLPLLSPSKEEHKDADWDYDGRTWHLQSHMLASHYGWSLEYISQLQVGEALAKIQEILVDEQLDREFQYDLSEIAYPYDAKTKTSKHTPLPRPHWMSPVMQPIIKFKMPRGLLPIGEVDYSAIPEEIRPKEIIN